MSDASGALAYVEVEHKFVVAEDFDLNAFTAKVKRLAPRRHAALTVEDEYFVTQASTRHVYRHRYDRELQHLTIKEQGNAPAQTRDTEARLEVNLDLGQHRGNQALAVRAFLAPLGITWSGRLTKELNVFEFEDCEVTHYTATAAGKQVACVEFEAVVKATMIEALAVLARYEALVGFDPATRAKASLFRLLLTPTMPPSLRAVWDV